MTNVYVKLGVSGKAGRAAAAAFFVQRHEPLRSTRRAERVERQIRRALRRALRQRVEPGQ